MVFVHLLSVGSEKLLKKILWMNVSNFIQVGLHIPGHN